MAKSSNNLGQEKSEAPLIGIREENKVIADCCVVESITKPCPPELNNVYDKLKQTTGKEAIVRLESYEENSYKIIPGGEYYFKN